MHIIGITGGIGSGKSYVCKIIETLGYPIFYCDDEAKHIIRTHQEVQQELCKLVGNMLYDNNGILQKRILASFLCQSKKNANQVDAIVHPRVADAFNLWHRQQHSPFVFMECALLYESGFYRLVQHVIHIDAPENVRLQRVMQRDNINEESARKWMNLQMPEEEKKARAHYCICNDNGANILNEIHRVLREISGF